MCHIIQDAFSYQMTAVLLHTFSVHLTHANLALATFFRAGAAGLLLIAPVSSQNATATPVSELETLPRLHLLVGQP